MLKFSVFAFVSLAMCVCVNFAGHYLTYNFLTYVRYFFCFFFCFWLLKRLCHTTNTNIMTKRRTEQMLSTRTYIWFDMNNLCCVLVCVVFFSFNFGCHVLFYHLVLAEISIFCDIFTSVWLTYCFAFLACILAGCCLVDASYLIFHTRLVHHIEWVFL